MRLQILEKKNSDQRPHFRYSNTWLWKKHYYKHCSDSDKILTKSKWLPNLFKRHCVLVILATAMIFKFCFEEECHKTPNASRRRVSAANIILIMLKHGAFSALELWCFLKNVRICLFHFNWANIKSKIDTFNAR